jgi:hypothetical protein
MRKTDLACRLLVLAGTLALSNLACKTRGDRSPGSSSAVRGIEEKSSGKGYLLCNSNDLCLALNNGCELKWEIPADDILNANAGTIDSRFFWQSDMTGAYDFYQTTNFECAKGISDGTESSDVSIATGTKVSALGYPLEYSARGSNYRSGTRLQDEGGNLILSSFLSNISDGTRSTSNFCFERVGVAQANTFEKLYSADVSQQGFATIFRGFGSKGSDQAIYYDSKDPDHKRSCHFMKIYRADDAKIEVAASKP